MPAVVGAWFADTSRRPIAMFGDGSFGMSMGDLETISRLRIPAILLNFNNSSFGYIKALQQANGYARPMSVDFSSLDCAGIAQFFGLAAVRIQRNDEIADGLATAIASAGPVFVDIRVPTPAELIPPMFNWLRKSGIDPLLVGGRPLEILSVEEVV